MLPQTSVCLLLAQNLLSQHSKADHFREDTHHLFIFKETEWSHCLMGCQTAPLATV